jgi:hypothetical protein
MGKGEVVQVFDPELTELQRQVLDSFHVPAGRLCLVEQLRKRRPTWVTIGGSSQ